MMKNPTNAQKSSKDLETGKTEKSFVNKVQSKKIFPQNKQICQQANKEGQWQSRTQNGKRKKTFSCKK